MNAQSRIMGLLLAAACASPVSLSAQHAVITTESAAVLAWARDSGKSRLTALIAADPDRTAAIAARALRLGAELRFEDGPTGYLRLRLPIGALDALARTPGVQTIELVRDMTPLRVSQLAASVEQADSERARAAARAVATVPPPPGPPYMALPEIGVPSLWREHPTIDGRGAVIAVVDGVVDLLHPELQRARALDGRLLPKILDVETASDPRDGTDPWWLDARRAVRAVGGRVQIDGDRFRVPHAGRYHVGRFVDAEMGRLAAEAGGRDPGAGVDSLFGVLWDLAGRRVWVDTDQDHDFRDDVALADFRVGHQVGVFGRPTGGPAQRVGFAIATDTSRHLIHITLSVGVGPAHGTMVASTAAGNRLSGGLFDGVAPAAQVIAINPFGAGIPHGTYGFIEGVLIAARDRRVDVINGSFGVTTSSGSGVSQVGRIVLTRVGAAYHKPFIQALGHAAPNIASVCEYQSGEMFRRNLRFFGEPEDFAEGGRLFEPDGGLLVDLVAPSGSISGVHPLRPLSIAGAAAGLTLPEGYQIGGGCSQATPMVSGVVALLVSGARQQHIPADAPRLMAALHTGARLVYTEGKVNELVQADGAWRALVAMRAHPPARIAVEAPVEPLARDTTWRRLFAPNGMGRGLLATYWPVRTSGVRTISLTRQSGVVGPQMFVLHWLGNDGTFTTDTAVSLRLDTPVSLSVHIEPLGFGPHIATLLVVDPASGATVREIGTTVLSPLTLASESPAAATAAVAETLMVGRHGSAEADLALQAGQPVELDLASPDTTMRYYLILPDQRVAPSPFNQHDGSQLFTLPRGITFEHAIDSASGDGRVVAHIDPGMSGIWRLTVARGRFIETEPPHVHTSPPDAAAVSVSVRALGSSSSTMR